MKVENTVLCTVLFTDIFCVSYEVRHLTVYIYIYEHNLKMTPGLRRLAASLQLVEMSSCLTGSVNNIIIVFSKFCLRAVSEKEMHNRFPVFFSDLFSVLDPVFFQNLTVPLADLCAHGVSAISYDDLSHSVTKWQHKPNQRQHSYHC